MGPKLGRLRGTARLALPVLALLLLAAHFYRGGLLVLAAGSCAMVALLFVRRPWAAPVLQATLLLGTLEWLRTAWVLASRRADLGQPYGRLLLILGLVATVTAVAAWVVRARRDPRH